MLKLVGFFGGMTALALGISQGLMKGVAPGGPAVAKPTAMAARATPPASAGPQAVSLSADDAGHFVTDVKINGIFVKGLVDTGATSIAIPGDTARQIGINPRPSDYNVQIVTANGTTLGARVRLNEVRISSIVVRDVEAVVVPQGLPTTLIGMSFIKRLSSEMKGNTLVLRQ